MGYTSAEVKNRYNEKVYDRITIVVPKGEKEELKKRAEAQGKSLNQFIKDKIDTPD